MGRLLADLAARTITGLAVPYGPVARVGGRRYRFTPGWARYGSVRLLRDHDQSQYVGKAAALADSPVGLLAVFRVFRGPAGDRALAIAAELGLSVGPIWQPEDLIPDPANPGVRLVLGGDLPEISLTAWPAFRLHET